MAVSPFLIILLIIFLVVRVPATYRVVSTSEIYCTEIHCVDNSQSIKTLLLEVAENISDFGADIEHLLITVSYETKDRLHLHITDASASRWEVPYKLVPRAFANSTSVLFPNLNLIYTVNPFSFTVTRLPDGEVIFDSPPSSAFIFKDQYLEISTRIPNHASLYGLGERTRSTGFRIVPNSTFTLWAADIGSATPDVNLYGSHPFYMDVRKGGRAHGVLLLNSNGMDIVYKDGFLTYKVIGGVLDFYFFAGPSPLSVVHQFTELVGKPAAIPYWSLGFHQCRWGYKNVSQLKQVVSGYRNVKLPLEVMWTDIDHMNMFKDFTLDPVNFSPKEMRSFINELHASDQRFVLIVDPGIKPDESYDTYKRAKALDVFIKDVHGEPYLGQVWPGPVHFPDFLHPRAEEFWTKEISVFHRQVPFDGLWIDMNEASNFCTGITCSLPPSNVTCPSPESFTQCCLVCNDSSPSVWDKPPYRINNADSRRELGGKTIPTSAKHSDGTLEYNAHNLYGFSEAILTNRALRKVLNKRPFVLSRSTFVGSGKVTAHWTGDNRASWNDLWYSITGILNSGLTGIPMVGADICGFAGDTTEELCNRWIQLGAFYPFSRNHNDLTSRPQELYVWKSVTRSATKALGLRYRLLPYLYTLLFEAHRVGSPVARPLFFSFSEDETTLEVDRQFMLGEGVMVSPVLTSKATSVNAYFPKGTWYNMFDYTKVVSSSGGYILLDAPWDTINVHVREGSIIPMQDFAMTTRAVRKSPFTLLVALGPGPGPGGSNASGELYLDDEDENVEMEVAKGRSSLVKFTAGREEEENGKSLVYVKVEVVHGEFARSFLLEKVVILGTGKVGKWKSSVVVGGKVKDVTGKSLETGVEVSGLGLRMCSSFHLQLVN